MGHIEVAHVDYFLPDGQLLLSDVSFRVGQAGTAALIGPNGSGKTTLFHLISGDIDPDMGTITTSGGVRVMPQFIGSIHDDRTVRDLLVLTAPPALQKAGCELHQAEKELSDSSDEGTHVRYAQAVADWSDIGGYLLESTWDACTMAALGQPYDTCQHREVRTLSGGEQKRLVLEALFRGDAEVLLLDEPDNYLDVPGKIWLENQITSSKKTILFSSHDRELLAQTARQIVSVEPTPSGSVVWVHGAGFASFGEAREARFERFEELIRRWEEQRAKLKRLVADLQQYAARSAEMASRYAAAQTRLAKFEEAGPPPEPPRKQEIRVRLRGGRTGVRALTCRNLELVGLMKPFDLEVFFGERVGVLGANGSGKSQFLKLLAGFEVPSIGDFKLGARVIPGYFAQTHAHPELEKRTLRQILWEDHNLDRGEALGALRRYELSRQSEQVFETLSGGQQARIQVLLLELGGSTMLLLDEPTDNLDLESAEALQSALEQYEGTVLTVTHDRWFAQTFDRYLIFGSDGLVRESPVPIWNEPKLTRS